MIVPGTFKGGYVRRGSAASRMLRRRWSPSASNRPGTAGSPSPGGEWPCTLNSWSPRTRGTETGSPCLRTGTSPGSWPSCSGSCRQLGSLPWWGSDQGICWNPPGGGAGTNWQRKYLTKPREEFATHKGKKHSRSKCIARFTSRGGGGVILYMLFIGTFRIIFRVLFLIQGIQFPVYPRESTPFPSSSIMFSLISCASLRCVKRKLMYRSYCFECGNALQRCKLTAAISWPVMFSWQATSPSWYGHWTSGSVALRMCSRRHSLEEHNGNKKHMSYNTLHKMMSTNKW